MTVLDEKVRRAQCRLWLNRWLRVLGWSAAISACVYIFVILPNKLFSLIDHPWFDPGAALGAVGLALVVSFIWFVVTRDSRHAAAAVLDQAAGLKERISTGLYCTASSDPFARAALCDAERVSRNVTPSKHMPIRYPKSASYALLTIGLAAMVSFLLPPMDLLGRQVERKVAEEKNKGRQQAEAVRRDVATRVTKLAEANPLLKEMAGLQDMDSPTEPKNETPLEARQAAMKKIDNVVQSLRERQADSESRSIRDVKQMLRRATEFRKDQHRAVRKLSEALASGDFHAAREALKEIRQELADAAPTPEQKQQVEALKEQMQALADRLEKAAAAQKLDADTAEKLEKAGISARDIEKKLANLTKEDIEKLKEQMEKKGLTREQAQKIARDIQQQQKACKTCKGLGQGLGLASSSTGAAGSQQQGADDQAAGFSMAEAQLSDLEQAEQEIEQLESTLADLQSLKNDLGKVCSMCDGTGMRDGKSCTACGGTGSRFGDSHGSGGGMGALGRGEGGLAQEAETPFGLSRKRTRVYTDPGALIGQTWVDGDQFKGEATAEFKAAAVASERDVAENIRKEAIPRQYHKTMSGYFERIARDVAKPADETKANLDGQQ